MRYSGTNNLNLLVPNGFFGSDIYGDSVFGSPDQLRVTFFPLRDFILYEKAGKDFTFKYIYNNTNGVSEWI